MSNARAGLASLTVNNINFDVVGDLKVDPSDVKQSKLVGQSGVQGRKVEPKAGMISAKLRDNSGQIVSQFNGMNGATAVAITASGKAYSGYDLDQTADNLEVDTMEGTFEIKLEGVVREG